MSISQREEITDFARFFLEPTNATHRQYEALRAYFVDRVPSAAAAEQFGYTPGSFRVLCHAFRQEPSRQFFAATSKGPRVAPKKERARGRVVELRKQNLSVYDISRVLEEEGERLSPAAVAQILQEEGFTKLPR